MPGTNANVATIFALTLPIVIGAAGFGVETSYWYYNSLKLQGTADAAAFAGALEQISGSDKPAIIAAATQSAATNGLGSGTIVVNTPPASGPNTAKKAVEVIVGQNLDRMFTSIFTQAQVPEHARAVALITDASKACVLALDPSASQAALFSGNTSVKLIGCSVMSDSIASDAIKLQGSAGLQADCLITAGGVSLSSPVTTVCAAPIPGAARRRSICQLPAPAASNPCQNANKSTLAGYLLYGLSLSGNVTLQPGVYVIQSGDLKVNANANVIGDGVTIYLAGASRVSMNGNATVSSAPTSGTYSGVLMYGDRTSTGGQSTFNGTAASLLTGALFPQQVNYLGNFSG